MGRQQRLTLPGRYDQVQRACQFIVAGARQAGLDEDALFQVELACDEACTNIIEHAYGGEDKGKLILQWHIENNEFIIIIQDNGRTFDPDAVPQPNLPTQAIKSAKDLKVGGLGVYFIRKLMDEVNYELDADKGNTLTMIKRRPE